ncbi:hypothetical protein PoB_005829600 [Plakobranchus ocellatus]|uniref:Uncharacterized protein n=1 Tax=Plakobranchus ocellatus TaxID=259542 RepID=A0AAV4CG52_9GAST|nr:hypothetical protein PoB_005829600 [Plakobranchus ocellatus]
MRVNDDNEMSPKEPKSTEDRMLDGRQKKLELEALKIGCSLGDLRLSGPPSGRGVGGGARTSDSRAPADFRAGSLSTLPPRGKNTAEKRMMKSFDNWMARVRGAYLKTGSDGEL